SLSTHLGTWDLLLRKCAHLTEYAILGALLTRATGSRVAAFVLAVAYAGTDEWHQTFVRGRHGSPVDVGIDAIGVLVGLWGLSRTRLAVEGTRGGHCSPAGGAARAARPHRRGARAPEPPRGAS